MRESSRHFLETQVIYSTVDGRTVAQRPAAPPDGVDGALL